MVIKKAIRQAKKEAMLSNEEWFVVELNHGFEAVSIHWKRKIGRKIPHVYSTKRGLVGKPKNKKRYFLAPFLLTLDERKRNLLFPSRIT